MIEVERPARAARRGRGKTDAIDAVLAARRALGVNADALPTPRCDGDREALRILLVAREDDDHREDREDEPVDRAAARRRRRRPGPGPRPAHRGHPGPDRAAPRHGQDTRPDTRAPGRRPPARDRDHRSQPGPARQQEATSPPSSRNWRRGCASGAGSARSAPPRPSCPGPTPAGAAAKPPTPASPAPPRSPPPAAAPAGTGSTAAATANSTAPSTTSPITRMRCCERTRAYLTRRRAEGLSNREIRRCLKRYIARELYRALTATATTKTP